MRFEVLTLFPEMLAPLFGTSILGRAVLGGKIAINCTNIRDYTTDKHRRVDDSPYGGGYGMVMACQPVVDCVRAVRAGLPEGKTRVVYLSPQGQVFNQKKAEELLQFDNLVLLCGHYEGIDERILELVVDEEISIGDYVLTGGELAAAVVVDAVTRLVDGVLPASECYENESIHSGLLEHPQYTRPRVFEGLAVPEVLFGGNHAEQEAWRKQQMEERTQQKRPDLWEKYEKGAFAPLFEKAKSLLIEIKPEEYTQAIVMQSSRGNIYHAVFMNPLRDEEGQHFLRLLTRKKDTKIDKIVCMWHSNGGVDLPSAAFRQQLCLLNEENRNAKMLLQGCDQYTVKPISSTIVK